jgi:hypothetical protein
MSKDPGPEYFSHEHRIANFSSRSVNFKEQKRLAEAEARRYFKANSVMFNPGINVHVFIANNPDQNVVTIVHRSMTRLWAEGEKKFLEDRARIKLPA